MMLVEPPYNLVGFILPNWLSVVCFKKIETKHGLKTAIVIVSGMAGNLVVKALSHTFEKVDILEIDKVYNENTPKNKVPQTFQPHVLLKSSETAIDCLFPGIVDQLNEMGRIQTNFTGKLKWY